jgi:hypothetical protein
LELGQTQVTLSPMIKSYCVLSPVYNDWDCAERLTKDLANVCLGGKAPAIFFIDDGSVDMPPNHLNDNLNDGSIIHLTRNLGHQKAIAIGLSYINDNEKYDYVVVMDSDGEDRPADIEGLAKEVTKKQDSVIFAHRKRRHEGIVFKTLYYVYRFLFQVLTGQTIAFGNFCIIPLKLLKKVAHVSEIWNHFSGGIIRSRIPYSTVPVDRGKRYFGSSKMNFTALIIHGISSITVHLDVVAVRLLMMAAMVVVSIPAGLILVLGIPTFKTEVSPILIGGVFGILISLLVIILFIALSLTFNVLFYRIQKPFIPALEYKKFLTNANE